MNMRFCTPQTGASENVFMKLRKIKIYSNKKKRFFEHQHQKQFMILISWLVSREGFFGVVRNKLQLLNI